MIIEPTGPQHIYVLATEAMRIASILDERFPHADKERIVAWGNKIHEHRLEREDVLDAVQSFYDQSKDRAVNIGDILEHGRARKRDRLHRMSVDGGPGDAKAADETRQLAGEFVGGTAPPTKRLAAAKQRLQTCEGRDESMAAIREFFEAKAEAKKPTHLHSRRNPVPGTTTLDRDKNESA